MVGRARSVLRLSGTSFNEAQPGSSGADTRLARLGAEV